MHILPRMTFIDQLDDKSTDGYCTVLHSWRSDSDKWIEAG